MANYVAYYRRHNNGEGGAMLAYPHLQAETPEQAEVLFKEWVVRGWGSKAKIEYWITTEHIHNVTGA